MVANDSHAAYMTYHAVEGLGSRRRAGGDAPEQLIEPDPPQHVSYEDRRVGLELCGLVGGRVNSSVIPLRIFERWRSPR
jgi:hypothetical protein